MTACHFDHHFDHLGATDSLDQLSAVDPLLAAYGAELLLSLHTELPPSFIIELLLSVDAELLSSFIAKLLLCFIEPVVQRV